MMCSVAWQHVQQKEENGYVELRRQSETTSKRLYQELPIPYFINYFMARASWWTGSLSGEVATSKLILTFPVTFDALQKTPSVLMLKLVIEGILLFFKENHPN